MAGKKARENVAKNANEELVITRIFDAPRELVWKAWTEPDLVKKWWGPKGFTAPFAQSDFRTGGKYLYCMRGKAGPDAPVRDYWSTGIYREIIPMEKIVATDSFADEKGNVVAASHYGMSPDFPIKMVVTVTLEEQDGKTKLTLRHAGMPASDIEGARQGWNESLDKLEEVVEKEKS